MATQAVVVGGHKWKKIFQRIADERVKLEVGVLEGKTNSVTNDPIAAYAFFNEYGTDTIPARPAFHQTIDDNESKWRNGVQNALKNKMVDGGVVRKTINQLGAVVRDDIKEKISSNMPPKNAESTRRHKAVDAGALVWTGSYLKSIDYKVT